MQHSDTEKQRGYMFLKLMLRFVPCIVCFQPFMTVVTIRSTGSCETTVSVTAPGQRHVAQGSHSRLQRS